MQIDVTKVGKVVAKSEKDLFLPRRFGRVVDCTGLENRRTERYRGFESLNLRFDEIPRFPTRDFFLVGGCGESQTTVVVAAFIAIGSGFSPLPTKIRSAL